MKPDFFEPNFVNRAGYGLAIGSEVWFTIFMCHYLERQSYGLAAFWGVLMLIAAMFVVLFKRRLIQ